MCCVSTNAARPIGMTRPSATSQGGIAGQSSLCHGGDRTRRSTGPRRWRGPGVRFLSTGQFRSLAETMRHGVEFVRIGGLAEEGVEAVVASWDLRFVAPGQAHRRVSLAAGSATQFGEHLLARPVRQSQVQHDHGRTDLGSNGQRRCAGSRGFDLMPLADQPQRQPFVAGTQSHERPYVVDYGGFQGVVAGAAWKPEAQARDFPCGGQVAGAGRPTPRWRFGLPFPDGRESL